MNLKALTEQREDLLAQLNEVLTSAKAEERELNEDEVNKFDALERQIKELDNSINEKEQNDIMENREIKAEATVEEREYKAFANYVRSVATGVENRDNDVNLTKGDNGAVIPKTIIKKIIEKVEEISPIYAKATKYTMGGTVAVPYEDISTDHITVAYGTEFTDLVSHSNKFASVELTGYLYGALTKISKSLLNNSDFDLVNWVVNKMAKNIAKFIEGELLNGTSNKVSGVARSYDSTNMKKTLANKSAITTDELIDAMELVPDAYQNDAIWVMNKATRTALRKLKDGDGNYVLCRDVASKFGYTIFGHDVYVSDNVNALGTVSKNVVFFGDFSGLAVKESEQREIQILREAFATQHAIGVVAWGEIDAKVEDAQKIAVIVTPNS